MGRLQDAAFYPHSSAFPVLLFMTLVERLVAWREGIGPPMKAMNADSAGALYRALLLRWSTGISTDTGAAGLQECSAHTDSPSVRKSPVTSGGVRFLSTHGCAICTAWLSAVGDRRLH
jgi:hypothetical protein